eukprot:CAMPEP_0179072856 /NCGR_PEP_ID=MMETSP0796-20121207/32271_1 /TAXON_ID=73915 /ORGANISM="Pyrodinium bahamense, Strain pbaha01" /LENGTH=208 /DNA_ID=CAMNT_0020770031 /DNA_START=16 /DNA_END=643 /DNA_ORIENTATION=+
MATRCLACLSGPCQWQIKRHNLCGPHAICAECVDRALAIWAPSLRLGGQFPCPICKKALGSRRRALEATGANVAPEPVLPPARRRRRPRQCGLEKAEAATLAEVVADAAASAPVAPKRPKWAAGVLPKASVRAVASAPPAQTRARWAAGALLAAGGPGGAGTASGPPPGMAACRPREREDSRLFPPTDPTCAGAPGTSRGFHKGRFRV